jgi:hypothetical protein
MAAWRLAGMQEPSLYGKAPRPTALTLPAQNPLRDGPLPASRASGTARRCDKGATVLEEEACGQFRKANAQA